MSVKLLPGTPAVFISHSNADSKVANRVRAALEAASLRCWIAPRDILPGRSWAESIIHAIHQCGVILLIFSSRADRSRQIAREVEHADNRNLPIVTFRLQNVAPTGALAYFTSAVQMIDAFEGPLKRHLDHLIPAIRDLLPPRFATRRVTKDRNEDYYLQGYSCIEKGRYSEAVKWLTKYIRRHSDDAAAFNLRGHAYNEGGKLRLAIDDFTRAIKLRPEFGEAYFHRANAYIRSRQMDEAIKDLNKSLRLDLDAFFLPYAYYNLGATLYERGRYKQAQQHLDRAIALDPKFGGAYYYRGQVRRKLADFRGSKRDLDKAARLGEGV